MLTKSKMKLGGYSEEGQQGSDPFIYAVYDDNTGEQLVGGFKCKEFLQDWYSAQFKIARGGDGGSANIYGFSWKYKEGIKPKLGFTKTFSRLTDKMDETRFIRFFKDWQEWMGHTYVEVIPDMNKEDGIFYFDLDRWEDGPVELALYTQLMRFAPFYTEEYSDIDKFISDAKDGKIEDMTLKDRNRFYYMQKLKGVGEIKSDWEILKGESQNKIHTYGIQTWVGQQTNK
jgi:hypothetical protein